MFWGCEIYFKGRLLYPLASVRALRAAVICPRIDDLAPNVCIVLSGLAAILDEERNRAKRK